MSIITKHFPVDSTLPSDYAQHSLLTGSVERALQQSALISSWLVAHLADLLLKVGVLEPDIDPSAVGLRDHFVLAYTDGVMADQGLWRIVVDYLSTCGVQGSARMSAVLMAVPLEVEADGGVAGASSVVEDVLRLCSENGLEAEMRSVCKVRLFLSSRQLLTDEGIALRSTRSSSSLSSDMAKLCRTVFVRTMGHVLLASLPVFSTSTSQVVSPRLFPPYSRLCVAYRSSCIHQTRRLYPYVPSTSTRPRQRCADGRRRAERYPLRLPQLPREVSRVLCVVCKGGSTTGCWTVGVAHLE